MHDDFNNADLFLCVRLSVCERVWNHITAWAFKVEDRNNATQSGMEPDHHSTQETPRSGGQTFVFINQIVN